jgi:DNA (cytosine-5)-methyltransferase 1
MGAREGGAVMGWAYYNEIDDHAAQWLRNLIARNLIAPGEVDQRSIEDVKPDELAGFVQCHFFAGIGVWSYALRRAGWPDDRPVWTGSCPCQPFSAAGKGEGFADERHLWPAWHWLISQCRPATLLGEQVASGNADPWLDLVQADLEAMDYAFGCVPFPAASVGAPHIRDRNYWMADDPLGGRREERPNTGRLAIGNRPQGDAAGFVHGGNALRLGDSIGARLEGHGGHGHHGHQPGRDGADATRSVAEAGSLGGVGDSGRSTGEWNAGAVSGEEAPSTSARGADGRHDYRHSDAGPPCGLADNQLQQRQDGEPRVSDEHDALGWVEGAAAVAGLCDDLRPGPTNGFWRDADWLGCRDGKWRPVEPGSFPLVDGSAFRLGSGSPFEGKSRQGLLKGFGNAIVAPQATEFIRAVMGAIAAHRAARKAD